MEFESIFDVLEERSSNPSAFAWERVETTYQLVREDILYEAFLIMFNAKNEPTKTRKFMLTRDTLIRCKVHGGIDNMCRNHM